MTQDLRSLSDAELTAEADKAWGRGETERLAALKAEKTRRANVPTGMSTWMKVLCFIMLYIIGANVAAAFGIGGLMAMLVGAAVGVALTPVLDAAVEKAQLRRLERKTPTL